MPTNYKQMLKKPEGFEQLFPETSLEQVNRIEELGNYYVWEKVNEVPKMSPQPENTMIYGNAKVTINYADNIKISDGSILLDNPQQVTHANGSQWSAIASIISGKYVQNADTAQVNRIYYIDSAYSKYDYGYCLYGNYSIIIRIAEEIQGYYITANNEMPKDNKHKYNLIKQLGQGIGSLSYYTGTGTYGANSPTNITFNFCPKLVFIYPNNYIIFDTTNYIPAILCFGVTTEVRYGSYTSTVTYLGNTMQITSNNDAGAQLNTRSQVYYYLAIG